MTSTTIRRRGLRAAVALATGAMLATFGLAAPASALDLDDARDGTATLTVHKHTGNTAGLPSDGTQQTVPNPVLPGVGFTLYRVTSTATPTAPDLGGNAGWEQVSALHTAVGNNPSIAALTAAGYTATSVGTRTTGADGAAAFTALPFGLYYVVESGALPGYSPIKPFLVTVPLTTQSGAGALTSWLYDVHVYPKNQQDTKEVDDLESVKTGDDVTWTITGSVPAGTVTGYQVRDILDARLAYKATRVYLGDPADPKSGWTALATPADYTLTAANVPADGAGTTRVNVLFTAAGLAKLSALTDEDVKVITEIDTTVLQHGLIPNDATIFNNDGAITSDTPTSEIPEVATKWGEVVITKVDVDDAAELLAGATFEVWSATGSSAFADATSTGISGTTNAAGTVTLGDLRFSDHAGGKAIPASDPAYVYYWLVETKAPAGYELLPEPIAFQLTTATANASLQYATTIKNVPTNGRFELPLTGGSGVTLFYVGGGLILAGVALVAVRRRRSDAPQD